MRPAWLGFPGQIKDIYLTFILVVLIGTLPIRSDLHSLAY
jgi:hypothetical protein